MHIKLLYINQNYKDFQKENKIILSELELDLVK